MVTAKSESENIVECLEVGANDYITKPVNIPVAIARIGTHYLLNKLNRENKEREEKLKRLSELTFEGVLIHVDKIIIEANQTFLSLSGYSLDEIIGKNINELFYPNEFDKIYSIIPDFQGKYQEITALKKNGTIYSAEIILRDLIYDSKKAKVTIIRDISDKKEYDKIYSQLQNNIRPTVENSNDNKIKIEIDKKSFTIKSMGKKINLTLTEFNLINYLFDKKNTVISIDELLENVLKYPPGTGNPDSIRTHITRIRAKIENSTSSPSILINIPRVGYMLKI